MRQNKDPENSEYWQFYTVWHIEKKEGIGFEGLSMCQGKNNKFVLCQENPIQ